jgi:hypothetical protein
MNTLESTYVATQAAYLAAQHEEVAARRAYRAAVAQLRDSAPEGEAALSVDRLAFLDEEAVQLSGLSESTEEVKRVRKALEAARAIKDALDNGTSPSEALGRVLGGGGSFGGF